MINPTHHLKKFVKYSGDDKPADFHVTEERGWLGSGLYDRNGKEIFEGDCVRIYYVGREVCETVTFDYGCLYLDGEALVDFSPEQLEVVGHIAEANNDNRT